jgi:hypothetical protein
LVFLEVQIALVTDGVRTLVASDGKSVVSVWPGDIRIKIFEAELTDFDVDDGCHDE